MYTLRKWPFFKRKACSKTSAKGDQWLMGNVFGSVLPLKDSSKVCQKKMTTLKLKKIKTTAEA